jgi:uncharacterized protein YjbI with pentapeptide repeats
MPTQFKQMKIEELVNELLAGERDFRRIQLPRNADLQNYEGFSDLQKYLKRQNLEENPISLHGSQLQGVKAQGIWLPFARLNATDLRYGDLKGANLAWVDLEEAQLGYADLKGVNLEWSNLKGANVKRADLTRTQMEYAKLVGTDFGEADFGEADFGYADFRAANLRNVKNLETVRNLSKIRLYKTKVTEEVRKIIEHAQPRDERFVIIE